MSADGEVFKNGGVLLLGLGQYFLKGGDQIGLEVDQATGGKFFYQG